MGHGEAGDELRGESRDWEAGEYDKGASFGGARVLVVYTILLVLFVTVAPGMACSSIVVAGLLVGIWALLFFVGLRSRFSGREIALQRRKFFDMGPDRLSRVAEGVMRDMGVRYHRTGPEERDPDIWSDRFRLMGPPWDGVEVLVRRDGLIARESPCQVTVQCGEFKEQVLDHIQERIDRAAEVERVEGRESRQWKVYPKYVTPPY